MFQGEKANTTTKRPSIDLQQEYWDERWRRTRQPNSWQRRRGQAVLNLINELPLENPRILDLGCATGWFTAQLSRLGEVIGIDLSQAAIMMAREDYPGVRYFQANIFDDPITSDPFDLIVSQEVIAHVPDQKLFVDKVADLLKPDGFLVITTANKFVMDRTDFGPDPDAHIKQWLTRSAFKRLLQPAFRIMKSTSAIPLGERGILRISNSHKLNWFLRKLFAEQRVEQWKEALGLGYSLILLAQRIDRQTGGHASRA